MNKQRVNLREIIQILEDPQRKRPDPGLFCDLIDEWAFIDNSYIDEKPFLVSVLRESNDLETLDFVLVTLNCISHSLDVEIIHILDEKIDIVISNGSQSSWTSKRDDVLGDIDTYLSKQGKELITDIIPLWQKLIKTHPRYFSKFTIFITLWRWVGIKKAISLSFLE